MTTQIDGKLIKDKSVDGNDLKDSIVINPNMSAEGGLVVMGSSGHIISASAGNDSVFLSGSTAMSGPVTITSGQFSVTSADLLEVTGSLAVAGSIVSSKGGLTVLGSSGSILSATTSTNEVVLSGSTRLSGPVSITSGQFAITSADLLEVTGTLAVVGNIKGSITKLANGSPFLLAGPGICLSTGSSGAISVSSSFIMSASAQLPTPTIPGHMMYDQDNIYIAINANTWKKIGLSSL